MQDVGDKKVDIIILVHHCVSVDGLILSPIGDREQTDSLKLIWIHVASSRCASHHRQAHRRLWMISEISNMIDFSRAKKGAQVTSDENAAGDEQVLQLGSEDRPRRSIARAHYRSIFAGVDVCLYIGDAINTHLTFGVQLSLRSNRIRYSNPLCILDRGLHWRAVLHKMCSSNREFVQFFPVSVWLRLHLCDCSTVTKNVQAVQHWSINYKLYDLLSGPYAEGAKGAESPEKRHSLLLCLCR
jgi:hypothetical protein